MATALRRVGAVHHASDIDPLAPAIGFAREATGTDAGTGRITTAQKVGLAVLLPLFLAVNAFALDLVSRLAG